MDIRDYLRFMVEKDGSDLYLSTGAPPSVKINGALTIVEDERLVKGKVHEIALSILDAEQAREFEDQLELNLAISEPSVGRFRVNIFKQRNETSMVIRAIKSEIPSIEFLGIPKVLTDLIMEKRGLVLFVGATGSGKSTSLASLIDHRNINNAGHIITIEDPIEFTHSHKKSIVNQREVGVDTESYEEALKNTLRQAPDVILIGEIRSQDTMEHAIAFAETGHLCLSTLHANNANQALERIINFFPDERKKQCLLDLSLNIKGIVSQRLVPTIDGKRVAAFEILLGTSMVQELIKRGNISEIKEIMAKSDSLGMTTFDNSLFHLHEAGKISLDEALRNADSQNNLRLRVQLKEGVTENSESHLEIIDEDKHNVIHPPRNFDSNSSGLSIAEDD